MKKWANQMLDWTSHNPVMSCLILTAVMLLVGFALSACASVVIINRSVPPLGQSLVPPTTVTVPRSGPIVVRDP